MTIVVDIFLEAYPEPCQASKIEFNKLAVIAVNPFFAKSITLDA